MKFSVTCISLAITLLAASSTMVQAAPVLGNDVAQLTADRVDLAGKIHADADGVTVDGDNDQGSGMKQAGSDITGGVDAEKPSLRRRAQLTPLIARDEPSDSTGDEPGDDATGRFATLKKRSPLAEGLLQGAGNQGNAGLVGGVVQAAGETVDGVIRKRSPLAEGLLQGAGNQGNAGLVDGAVQAAGSVTDDVIRKRSESTSDQNTGKALN
ncbi:hypothetical protein [Absidia glauca]|uniref:Phage infection protein n=1 Tax=Absidia glauca TaxID=4829 RepID=A0A168PV48_ABSGL|nr:hypothetical protein [Absidia glauca]